MGKRLYYIDVNILVSGTIRITGQGGDDDAKRADERHKRVIFKNCALFTKCISNINNTQTDDANVEYSRKFMEIL